MMHWLESFCAALLLAAAIILVGYGWLMHAEAVRNGSAVVVMGGEHGE